MLGRQIKMALRVVAQGERGDCARDRIMHGTEISLARDASLDDRSLVLHSPRRAKVLRQDTPER
jgi:hypothetical protein